MDKATFEKILLSANAPDAIALLARDAIEDTLDLDLDSAELIDLPARIDTLLEKGLDPNIIIDGQICISDLQYGYTYYHLEAARRIFERTGLPTAVDEEGGSFIDWIRTKLDFNYYNCDHIVKLYLLCAAYSSEETYLKMHEGLYPEMFAPESCYISKDCLPKDSAPLKLTPAIFKEIHKYDYCVEMLEQEDGKYGCWRLHIFDKESKIEVAVYE